MFISHISTRGCEVNSARRMLEFIRLEKAALARWMQELDQRELEILRWVEKDEAQGELPSPDILERPK